MGWSIDDDEFLVDRYIRQCGLQFQQLAQWGGNGLGRSGLWALWQSACAAGDDQYEQGVHGAVYGFCGAPYKEWRRL